MFPGLTKAPHREEAFLVPHSSCLCLHRVKETQSRERSRTCVCGLDVVCESFLTDLWTGCCDPFCLETPLLVLVLFIIFTWPEVYLPFHLHIFLSCALTSGSYFIRHFMLKHSVKNTESKEIKGGLKWTLSIKNRKFLLEFAEAVAFFRAGVSWKVFSPSGSQENQCNKQGHTKAFFSHWVVSPGNYICWVLPWYMLFVMSLNTQHHCWKYFHSLVI